MESEHFPTFKRSNSVKSLKTLVSFGNPCLNPEERRDCNFTSTSTGEINRELAALLSNNLMLKEENEAYHEYYEGLDRECQVLSVQEKALKRHIKDLKKFIGAHGGKKLLKAIETERIMRKASTFRG